jgi:hypothetical protein
MRTTADRRAHAYHRAGVYEITGLFHGRAPA